jgi:radical SAM family uncharacterized protein/radical SAM-linked protein
VSKDAQAAPAPSALDTHPYAAFLPRVKKPGRYLGGEEQSVVKSHEGLTCRFVLAFPDLYEIGMSHLGTRILYSLINAEDDLVCERAFSPWADMEAELRARDLPLISLETQRPLREFDAVGVSLQYELSYSNVLLNLELGGIPLRSEDRGDDDPIVLAGGPTATHPEPLAPFVDAFLVGEAEDVLLEALRLIGQMRQQGAPRVDVLAALARRPGFYVPRFYAVAEDPRTELQVVTGPTEEGTRLRVPATVERVWVRDLAKHPFPTRFPVPYAEAIFDRASVEITRGCTEGCRFCQAGMIYRPVRERTPEAIVDAVLEGTDAAGFAETSLTALSTADVSCIDPLIKTLVPELAKRKVSLGIASLRAYGLNEDLIDEIQRVGIDGLTFAPEAGTQRMRDVINKNVSDEDILSSARRIFSRGMERMKLYFIMGLPTETDADVAGIVETGEAVLREAKTIGVSRARVTVSVSQHVPKPHTPFQWAAMDSMEDLETKVRMLRDMTKRSQLSLKTHTVRESWLECLFARGDRRMGAALEHAYAHGARFDGWRECFDFSRWLDALEHAGVEPERYTRTLPVGVPLPWSHLDMGFEPDFLESEWRKAVRARVSPPCGKPVGAQVHPRTLEESAEQTKRLVCYDCGIACDLGEMRDERVTALRSLDAKTRAREAQESSVEAAAAPSSPLIPADRLRGRLAASNLAEDNAFKANAEAPYSRVRIFFAKRGTAAFLSHLDLVRVFPRAFRRAGLELAFTRGFSPQPRMTFGPALALGMSADEEVVDVDLVLPRSVEDMTSRLEMDEREAIARDLADRLRDVAPPGIEIHSARLVRAGEKKIGELVTGADYAVEVPDAMRSGLEQAVQARLSGALQVERTKKVKRKKQRRGRRKGGAPASAAPATVTLDLHTQLGGVRVAEGRLHFRLRRPESGPSARPREVVEALLGARVDDHLMRRERLLGLDEDAGEMLGLRDLGAVMRPAHRLTGDPRARA